MFHRYFIPFNQIGSIDTIGPKSVCFIKGFKLIKEAGFDGVILWWGDDHADVDGDKTFQPELARQKGLFVENIHTPFFHGYRKSKPGKNT